MSNFVNNLRMAGIFKGGGLGPPNTDSAINLDEIKQLLGVVTPFGDRRREREQDFEKEMWERNRSAHLEDIARSVAQSPSEMNQPQMRTVLGRDSGGNDLLGQQKLAFQREDAARKAALAQERLGITDRDSDTRRMRADIYGNMHDLTDAEKLEIMGGQRRGDIGARNTNAIELQGIKGTQATELQNSRNTNAMNVQGSRNENVLAGIAARVAGAQGLQDSKPIPPVQPTQERVEQNNRARQLVIDNPALADFIHFDDKGGFTIDEFAEPGVMGKWLGQGPSGPNAAQQKLIQQGIYGTPPVVPIKKKEPIKKPTEVKSKYSVEIK